jgi:hypothetical protein
MRVRSLLLVAAAWLLLAPGKAGAITVDAFGPNGAGGAVNDQSFSVGGGGEVFELDAFVNIAGQDLNGAAPGTSAQLSVDPLPAGLDYTFSFALSADATDIILSYEFENNTGSLVEDLVFLSFLDAEIDEPLNGFFDELAALSGTPAAGQGFEADEPGYAFGDIFDHLQDGALDGSNIFPPQDDVSMALSFALDPLAAGALAEIQVMISEDGDFLGGFAMTQTDADPRSTTEITYSGVASVSAGSGPPVPEPHAALLFAVGLGVVGRSLRRR